VQCGLGLPDPAQKEFLGKAGRLLLSGLPKSQCLFGQTFLEGLFVLDAAALLRHGATPFGSRLLFELGGRQNTVLVLLCLSVRIVVFRRLPKSSSVI
jgi:hypothetical protein